MNFIMPVILGLATGGIICLGIELHTDCQMEKDRPTREVFFEALDRKHKYCCEQGKTDKSIQDYIREVEEERSSNRKTRSNRVVTAVK